jgi:hypothetical protein
MVIRAKKIYYCSCKMCPKRSRKRQKYLTNARAARRTGHIWRDLILLNRQVRFCINYCHIRKCFVVLLFNSARAQTANIIRQCRPALTFAQINKRSDKNNRAAMLFLAFSSTIRKIKPHGSLSITPKNVKLYFNVLLKSTFFTPCIMFPLSIFCFVRLN